LAIWLDGYTQIKFFRRTLEQIQLYLTLCVPLLPKKKKKPAAGNSILVTYNFLFLIQWYVILLRIRERRRRRRRRKRRRRSKMMNLIVHWSQLSCIRIWSVRTCSYESHSCDWNERLPFVLLVVSTCMHLLLLQSNLWSQIFKEVCRIQHIWICKQVELVPLWKSCFIELFHFQIIQNSTSSCNVNCHFTQASWPDYFLKQCIMTWYTCSFLFMCALQLL
jgi:hypothetical protein